MTSMMNSKDKMEDGLKKTKKIIIKKTGGGMPGGTGFWQQAFLAVVIFFLLSSLYSALSSERQVKNEISLSELAQNVEVGEVADIKIVGETLELTYASGEEKIAKKEIGTALTTTLKNYNVSADALSKVKIEVRDDRGFLYWFASLAPIFIPILFIVFFLWFLSRQVKGAGMQAFTFGQSKARLTTPDDKASRGTFKDVAGAR